MIVFYMKCVILGKHLFSLFLVTCVPPTYLFVLYQGQATVRLTVVCISGRDILSGNFCFAFSPSWYLKCAIRGPCLLSEKEESFLQDPSWHSLPDSAHTEPGCVWSRGTQKTHLMSSRPHSVLMKVDTLGNNYNKHRTGPNRRMPRDKGQGPCPQRGGEPVKTQLPGDMTFKWIIGGGRFVYEYLLISIINCYYYHCFIFIYFWNSSAFTFLTIPYDRDIDLWSNRNM